MRLDELEVGEAYRFGHLKVTLVQKDRPYGPAQQPIGVVVQMANGEQLEARCQELRAWTKLDERRWLASRRPA